MKNLMRIFVVLICSLGLVTVGYSAQPEQSKQKKKQPPAAQHGRPPAAGHAPAAGASPKRTSTGAYQAKKGQGQGQTSMGMHQGKQGKPGKPGEAGTTVAGKTAKAGKPFKRQYFNLPKQPNTAKAPPAKFQQ